MNLKSWRKSKGWTQGEIAKRIDVIPGTYGAYETGRIAIPPDVQGRIKKLGYAGPWPREEAQEAPTPAAGAYVTREEFAELRGRLEGKIEDQGKDVARLRRRLGEAFALIQDLGRRAGIELPTPEPVE